MKDKIRVFISVFINPSPAESGIWGRGFAFSSPKLSSAAVKNDYSRIVSLHEPLTFWKMGVGGSFSTTCGMSLLVNLKCWIKLFIGLKREMGAALADLLLFAH